LGFQALQIGIGAHADEEKLTSQHWLSSVREAAGRYGIEIAGIALNILEAHGTGTSPACAARRRALELTGRAVEAARKIGASLVYVPAFGNNRIAGGAALERAAEFLRAACRIAADSAIVLASENTLGVDDNIRLARDVNKSNFRILIDTYNPLLCGHDPRSLIFGLRPWLAGQAHVKDGIGTELGAAPLGQGSGDPGSALEAFAAIGYRGTFFLENDYHGANSSRACADINYVRHRLYNSMVYENTTTTN
jgi:sugar phosphate isomerase/epimerase